MEEIRTYRSGDFAALADLINAARPPGRAMTAAALEEFLDYPWFRPETDLFVANARGGGRRGALTDDWCGRSMRGRLASRSGAAAARGSVDLGPGGGG